MKRTFKCEYCGRSIKTEECPYCGGVNDIPVGALSDRPSGKAADYIPPYPPRNIHKNNTFLGKVLTFFKIHSCLRALVLSVLFVVVVLVISFMVWLINEDSVRPEFNESDTMLVTDKNFSVSVTAMGKTWDIRLPSPISEISQNITFLPPIINDTAQDDPDTDGILDLLPFRGTTLRDSYGLFYYDIINDSYDTVPYTDAVCDKFNTYRSSYKDKMTSLKVFGKELITDMDSVIEALGEPTETTTYPTYKEIEYRTTGGRITLTFEKDDSYAFPDSIYIENLMQNRKYY